ncbi:hypothetical protein ACIQYG_11055 [Peribacillus sp. NPDC096622]|uniref:hypothetical protein n=1 Tax=Peribacillus sp. NPDC096622 TaxID=3364396 RepID=UPI00381478F8
MFSHIKVFLSRQNEITSGSTANVDADCFWGINAGGELLVLANSAVVPVDLEIEVNEGGCPESRIDRETAVQEKLDLHNVRWVHIHGHSPL